MPTIIKREILWQLSVRKNCLIRDSKKTLLIKWNLLLFEERSDLSCRQIQSKVALGLEWDQ